MIQYKMVLYLLVSWHGLLKRQPENHFKERKEKMKKRIIGVLLACVMILAVLPALVGANDDASAETDDIVISIENDAQLTEGSSVFVDVNIEMNTETGIVSATIPVAWNNEALELVKVNEGTVIPDGWMGAPESWVREEKKDGTTLGIYYLAWNNDTLCNRDADGNPEEKSYNDSGRLCTLEFKLREGVNVEAGTKYDVEVLTEGENAAISNIMTWDMEDFLNQRTGDDISGQTVKFEDGSIVMANDGVTISGTVTSFDIDTSDTTNDTITIELFAEGSETAAYTTTCVGKNADYSISGVKCGKYIMKVSKAGHVPREYKIEVVKD